MVDKRVTSSKGLCPRVIVTPTGTFPSGSRRVPSFLRCIEDECSSYGSRFLFGRAHANIMGTEIILQPTLVVVPDADTDRLLDRTQFRQQFDYYLSRDLSERFLHIK